MSVPLYVTQTDFPNTLSSPQIIPGAPDQALYVDVLCPPLLPLRPGRTVELFALSPPLPTSKVGDDRRAAHPMDIKGPLGRVLALTRDSVSFLLRAPGPTTSRRADVGAVNVVIRIPRVPGRTVELLENDVRDTWPAHASPTPAYFIPDIRIIYAGDVPPEDSPPASPVSQDDGSSTSGTQSRYGSSSPPTPTTSPAPPTRRVRAKPPRASVKVSKQNTYNFVHWTPRPTGSQGQEQSRVESPIRLPVQWTPLLCGVTPPSNSAG